MYLQHEKKKSVDVLESPSKKIRKDKNEEGIEKAEKSQKVKNKIDLSLQPEPDVVKTKRHDKTREIDQPVRKKRSPRLNNDVTDDKLEGIKKVEKMQKVKSKKNLTLQPEPEVGKTQQLEKTREIEQPVRKRRSPRLNNDVTDDKQHSNIGRYYIKNLQIFNILKLFLFIFEFLNLDALFRKLIFYTYVLMYITFTYLCLMRSEF